MFGRILGLGISLAVMLSGMVVVVWSAQWIFSGSLQGLQTLIVMNSLSGAGFITSIIGIIMVYAWSEN